MEKIDEISETKIAYIAGFIDGEGCIRICKSGKTHCLLPYVSITNTNLEILEYIKEYTEGSIYTLNRPKNKQHWKIAYQLTIRGRKALNLLLKIQPYILVKKKQINTVIDFVNYKESMSFKERNNFTISKTSGKSVGNLKEEVITKELEYYNIITELNKKGN